MMNPEPIDPATLKAIQDEIVAGLSNEKPALDDALENQAFWEMDGEAYIPMREAESFFDYAKREKRSSGFMRECVEVLTGHLYNPGPARSCDDGVATQYLERVWQDNDYDALLLEADQLAHVNRVCAIQIDACEGVFDEKPITLRLWGREEFCVWTEPTDFRKVLALCTVERFDLQTRYRLWTSTEVYTYATEKANGTADGRVPELIAVEPHDYGRIPFAFAWFSHPTRNFFPPSPGCFLRKAEVRIDDRLSRLDEGVHKGLNGLPWVKNVKPGWQPMMEPGRFVILTNRGPNMTERGYEQSCDPEVGFLRLDPATKDAWLDLEKFIRQVMEAAHVPMISAHVTGHSGNSGVELMVEQEPLIRRAKKRRAIAGFNEKEITRAILECSGNHYGVEALRTAAKTAHLSLRWPEPYITIPTLDRTQIDQADEVAGYKSKLQIIQERYSCTRDESVAIYTQICADKLLEATLLKPVLALTDAGQNGDAGGVIDDDGDGKPGATAGPTKPNSNQSPNDSDQD